MRELRDRMERFIDSAANLPAVTAKKYDIHVVSFVNLVNGKELVYHEKVKLKPEDRILFADEEYIVCR